MINLLLFMYMCGFVLFAVLPLMKTWDTKTTTKVLTSVLWCFIWPLLVVTFIAYEANNNESDIV